VKQGFQIIGRFGLSLASPIEEIRNLRVYPKMSIAALLFALSHP
jgi:hypothetical protein